MPSSPGQARACVLQRGDIELARPARRRCAPLGAPPIADAPGQPPRVDAGEADQAVRLEPGIERLRRAVVRRLGDVGAQHEAARRRRRRLDVLAIGADIADMGEGEGDDLPGIGGIGQDLLIAGHRRC